MANTNVSFGLRPLSSWVQTIIVLVVQNTE